MLSVAPKFTELPCEIPPRSTSLKIGDVLIDWPQAVTSVRAFADTVVVIDPAEGPELLAGADAPGPGLEAAIIVRFDKVAEGGMYWEIWFKTTSQSTSFLRMGSTCPDCLTTWLRRTKALSYLGISTFWIVAFWASMALRWLCALFTWR